MQDGIYSAELVRLMAAAVISPDFCIRLLKDPAIALCDGYQGRSFRLSREEREIVCSICATSVHDFAAQLVTRFNSEATAQQTERVKFGFAPDGSCREL